MFKGAVDLTESKLLDVVEIPIVEGVATLQANKANVLDASSATVSITMPTVTGGKENVINLYITTDATSAVTFPAAVLWPWGESFSDFQDKYAHHIVMLYTVDDGVSWHAIHNHSSMEIIGA